MDLLVTISPNITESIQDTASPYYRTWNWLNKNPDLDTVTDERKVQRWVLALFYRFLHGDEWTFSEGWLEIAENSVDECTWYNVLCDSSGHVVSLDLRNNYLWGDIPSEIAFLDKCGERRISIGLTIDHFYAHYLLSSRISWPIKQLSQCNPASNL